jgi:Domain of unknown function (DUF4276)
MRKRLVLFVEGEGDERAMPALVKMFLRATPEVWQFLDHNPKRDVHRVGNANDLAVRDRSGKSRWERQLLMAMKAGNLGGVLLVIDGDLKKFQKDDFNHIQVARHFAASARETGAGEKYSVGIVISRQEYESWLIASCESLPGIRSGVAIPPNIEEAPRDAAGWLDKHIQDGYNKALDQERLTQAMNFDLIRADGRKMCSFLRMERALREVVEAIRADRHVATPAPAD